MSKKPQIETLRGIAILLVVIGHVIGSTPEGGMKIDFPSYWRYLYSWIDYIQMPLFTAIAGWVYALKPVDNTTINKFITKKVYRLLIPMAVAATLYFLVQYIVPGTNQKGNLENIWKIYIFPYTIYWYLPSLFLMFIFITIIDVNKWMNSLSQCFLCLLGAYIGLIFQRSVLEGNMPNYFSFMGAIAQFPYFITGIGINRFSNKLLTIKSKKIYYSLAAIGIILLQFQWFYPLKGNIIYTLLQPIWVIALLLLLLSQTYSNRFFIWIGSYAYIIYLYHGFGTSGGRIILSRLGVNAEICTFLFATSIALAIPILLWKIAQKVKILRFLILGIK